MGGPTHAQDRLGRGLVVLQFVLMGLLALWGAPAFVGGFAPVGAWLLAGAGVAVGLWAVSANRPGNFNIRPTPRAGARLVQSGPYRWIRHPMYTSVIVLGFSAAWAAARPWAWAATIALVAVLGVKSVFEERWMLAAHAGYAAYRARTRRFVPGLL